MRRTSKLAGPAVDPLAGFRRRRKPRSTTLLMWASIWSINLASLLLSGRNTRTSSTMSSRVNTRRVSLPPASNSASFLRSSASSRLTGNDSGLRATRRGSRGLASSSAGSGRLLRNA
ncbi:MAG: hypothetical protein H6R12_1868 [Proteobacteria bacterium]|nr:hypothetical protein [Pseudomonadota bacterium]